MIALARGRTLWLAAIVALVAAFLYSGYEFAESPGNQLFGKTVVSGPSNERVVALTFDDGPNPPYTDAILSLLRAEHVHATFFLVGRAVAAYPAVVRRTLADGNAIGNHSWDHGHLVLEDAAGLRTTLDRTDRAIWNATGTHTDLMRPPFGSRDWLVLAEARKLGYTPVMWSVPLAREWEYPSASTIAARVLPYVHDGAIIDLHDGNEGLLCLRMHLAAHVCDRRSVVGATKLIVDALKRDGYRFVTIPELLELGRPTHIAARAGG